jgi:hypothetical protein
VNYLGLFHVSVFADPIVLMVGLFRRQKYSIRAMFKFVSILIAAGLSMPCSAAALAAFERPSATRDKVHGGSFGWELSQKKMVVSEDGLLEISSEAPGQGGKRIQLPLEMDEGITNLFVRERGADVFLALDASVGGSGRGMLCRIATRSASIRWCRPIRGFNIFAAMGNDDAIFVGAIGFVGRVDPTTGRIIWQQSGLYKKDQTFNVFCAAEEDGNVVSMFGTSGGSFPSVGKRIRLDSKTGEILSISAEVPGRCRAGQFFER